MIIVSSLYDFLQGKSQHVNESAAQSSGEVKHQQAAEPTENDYFCLRAKWACDQST